MQAHELMTLDPIEVSPSDPLGEAVALMEEHEVRHLAVVEKGVFLGIVSERDLLRATGWLVSRSSEDDVEVTPAIVRDVLHTQPVTSTPDEDVSAIARRLFEWGIGCVPVVEKRDLVGIVTEVDVLRAFLDRCRYGRASGDENPPIERLMTRDVETASPDTTSEEAWRAMHAGDFRHLPVVEDGCLLGIVSERDLLLLSGRGESDETPIGEIMCTELVTARADDPASYAARQMVDSRIGATPVVDDDCLVGMLTSADLMEHCANVLR